MLLGNNYSPFQWKETLPAQIKDNLGCLDFDLEQGHIDHLNELAKPQLGYPYQVLQSEMYRNLIYGNTFDLIENHRE